MGDDWHGWSGKDDGMVRWKEKKKGGKIKKEGKKEGGKERRGRGKKEESEEGGKERRRGRKKEGKKFINPCIASFPKPALSFCKPTFNARSKESLFKL